MGSITIKAESEWNNQCPSLSLLVADLMSPAVSGSDCRDPHAMVNLQTVSQAKPFHSQVTFVRHCVTGVRKVTSAVSEVLGMERENQQCQDTD